MPRSRTSRWLTSEPWREFAICIGNEHLFFAEETEAVAKELCANCPVAFACLEVGMHETDGIWGGMSPLDRRALRRYMRVGRSLEEALKRFRMARGRAA